MTELDLSPVSRYGYDFIPPQYLPPGRDEYWLRNEQAALASRAAGRALPAWRKLRPGEIETLVKNDNRCSAWDELLVSDPFDPMLVRNSAFYGLVRLGALRKASLRHHDFRLPAGIRNSTIISCDIGDDPAIQDCSYVSHYIIGSRVILSRIDELQTTNHAKFGNGVIAEGEDEEVRIWIDVMNEAGGRSILPFASMISADAFLWAAYRDDIPLTEKLKEMTQRDFTPRRGVYGTIGEGAVVKSCGIIKDAASGEGAYIKGANKLKNITILSSEAEPSQIGEGVELINGIVGYGCHVFYGSKAVRFVMGRNCNLKYGARLIHSVLGDNSTISCCEILNNLIFPIHEQHHNNSFLIACLIQGMSNMAAGATIGSNHNSRANDGEIRAGRGFWPGLSVTLKHSSRFASFVLIAKGDYPYELNIGLPFSLVNHNVKKDRLEVMPAYFWMYNLYALERNSWKAADRDKRKVKVQRIETGYLAPDTAEEIITALSLMEGWMRDAGVPPAAEPGAWGASAKSPGAGPAGGDAADDEDPEYAYIPAADESLPWDEIPAAGLERHNRKTVLLKPLRARAAYREMLRYYGMKTLADFLVSRPDLDFPGFLAVLDPADCLEAKNGGSASGGEAGRVRDWVNLGGQIVPAHRLDALRGEIREGKANTWEAVHRAYDEMAAAYPRDRLRHSWATLAYLEGDPGEHPWANRDFFKRELLLLVDTRRRIAEQVYRSRAKDFHDPFRGITYRNNAEMEEVAGNPENNFFVTLVKRELSQFESDVNALLARL
ncbi:MAG: DUF4954 family protein [Spirochaetaceae bacterium]|jgi:hypothetical protein|nr:DUF4954 family protein [Spirochaetaceae bacterium]